MILYIRLVTEKMWVTSKKCVFYGIFKNTTKHQKIFSEKFFKMQPNTWKHFPFPEMRKIEYFPEILLHKPNAALHYIHHMCNLTYRDIHLSYFFPLVLMSFVLSLLFYQNLRRWCILYRHSFATTFGLPSKSTNK